MMTDCWNENPDNRPNFKTLVKTLEAHIGYVPKLEVYTKELFFMYNVKAIANLTLLKIFQPRNGVIHTYQALSWEGYMIDSNETFLSF